MPGQTQKGDVGLPDLYVIHAWDDPFCNLVEALLAHLAGSASASGDSHEVKVGVHTHRQVGGTHTACTHAGR